VVSVQIFSSELHPLDNLVKVGIRISTGLFMNSEFVIEMLPEQFVGNVLMLTLRLSYSLTSPYMVIIVLYNNMTSIT